MGRDWLWVPLNFIKVKQLYNAILLFGQQRLIPKDTPVLKVIPADK